MFGCPIAVSGLQTSISACKFINCREYHGKGHLLCHDFEHVARPFSCSGLVDMSQGF